MKKNLFSLLTFFSLLVTCFGTQAQPCKQVIGYYPNWQWYDRAHLVNPATINYSKYTVINYAFFAPQDNGSILTTDAWADENLLLGQINWATTPTSYYPNTSIIDRAHNAGVKVVPSIGGWTLSDKFPAIAADATKRANFAHACIQLCQQYNFDGIDIDWEYPGYTEHLGTTADKHNFTIFLQQIRDSLTTYGTSHNKTMLLTACVGASQSNMSNIEWGNIASVLDYINLMSYDFFGSWDATANHNAPLYAPAQGDPNFNLNSAVQYLLTHYGVPANKINAGTAFYGRSAKTTGTPALFAPISGTDAVTFSEDEGSPLYYNIAKRFNLFSQQWDSQAQVPYLLGLNGLNTFVSYDNAQSIALKAQYIVNNNLAGAIIWEITGDYLETAIGSGVIADTPLADTLNYVFCNNLPPITCNTPTALAATPANTSAVLNWASTGAASYQIQIKPLGSTTWTTVTSTANSKTISGLTACTNYEYKVASVCSNTLSSAYSTAFGFQTTGCVNTCNTPTALAATPANTSAVLNWASTGAASYQIQYKLATATTWTTVTSTANSKTISGLTACTNYEYKVASVCSNTLSSTYSTAFGFQTTGCVNTCNTPTALAATPANTSAVLNWASTGAASYQIQIRPVGSATWITVTSTTNSKTINGLTACTNYEYKVASVCSNTLSSAYSTAFGFQTTGCVNTCNTPTALAATPANTSAVLNWASTGAASYQIQYKLATATTWTSTTSTTNSKTINGLTACTNYQFRVKSVCSNTLSSAYSAAFGFQTTNCSGTGTTAPTNYCSSYSLNATQEWIQNYSIGTINNNSGNNSGFGNFVDQSTNLSIGGGATISFTAGYTGTPVTEYWKVLIDYNRNGSFADAGETVISTTTTNNSTFTQAITVPATASVGYARMRVQLKRGASPTECDIYSGGEVEDYLVNLTTTSGKNSNFVGIDATLYPNPVTDVLSVTTNLPTNTHNTLTLTDVYGKAIRSIAIDTNNTGSYTTNFDGLANLPSGVYFVVISSNNSVVKTLKCLKD